MQSCLSVWGCLALILVTPAAAQQRAVNLTGRPAASIAEGITSVAGLQEVAPGKIVLSDPQEQRLILADFTTSGLRDISTKGGGPGEWQMAMGVHPGTGNTAWVPDPSLRKVHVIDATARIVNTVPFPDAESASPGATIMALPRGTDSQGRLYFSGSPFTPGNQSQPDSLPIFRWDPRSKKTDTLAMLKNEMVVQQSSTGGGSGMRVMMRTGSGPYSPQTLWAPLPDGRVAIVHPDPYRVDIVEAPGRIRTGTAVPYTPVRIGKAERDAHRARVANTRPQVVSIGGGGRNVSMPTPPPIADGEFPATMPPFGGGIGQALHVAPNGEVWVLRNRAANDPTPVYDIWSTTGQMVGKATLRPHSTVVGFGQGSVYVARQDPEDDLRYLERYAL